MSAHICIGGVPAGAYPLALPFNLLWWSKPKNTPCDLVKNKRHITDYNLAMEMYFIIGDKCFVVGG